MTAADLVAGLVGRGVRFDVQGDRLRYRPADQVTEAEREALRQRKAEVLGILQPADRIDRIEDDATVRQVAAIYATLPESARATLRDDADAGDNLATMILSAVLTCPAMPPCAWRLYARRLDRELWVVRDAEALAELERDEARSGLPVIFADDLPRLRDLDDLTLHATLDTCAAWPGCRVVDAMPEGAA